MSRMRMMFLVVCVIGVTFSLHGFRAQSTGSTVVGVEIYSDDPDNPGKERALAGLPWNDKGELGSKADPNAPIRNPYKDLLRYDAKRKAKQAIQSLKNGDSLVIGFHANPRGFQDGSQFVEWKDFWGHFGIDRNNAPRLKSVVVCGCMLNMASGVLGSVVNISIDENGVNHIKNSMNADAAFVPKTTYDTGSLQDARSIVDWLRSGKSLEELKALVKDLSNFHFAEAPRPPGAKVTESTPGTGAPKTAPTAAELKNAYQNGYDVGKQVRNGTMSMDDVKRIIRDAYGDVAPELKAAFRKGYADGSAQ